MDISERGIALIKDYESYSGEAYLCPEGVATIGWGSIRWDARRPVKLGDKCTVEQAEMLLRKECSLIEDAIDTCVRVPLTQGQADCLVSWGYNVGVGWINGRREGGAATLIKYLNAGQYDKVPSELLKFRKGANTGNVIDGLINRRKREIKELWLHEEDVSPPVAAMPQVVEPERASIPQVVRESPTIWASIAGAIFTLLTWIQQGYDWLFGIVKEVGPELVNIKTSLSPFDALWKLTPAILSALTLATIGYVIVRRLTKG